MRTAVKSALIISAISFALPAISHAQSVSTSTSGFAGDRSNNGNSKTDADTSSVVGASSHGIDVSYSSNPPSGLGFDWGQSSSALATANASNGKLHLVAQAHAELSPSYYVFVDEANGYIPQFYSSPLTGLANSSASGTIIDTINITSGNLPNGTPVDLEINISLDCSLSSPPNGSAQANANLTFYKTGYQYLDDSGNSNFGYIQKGSNSGQIIYDFEQTSNTLHTFVGDSFTVEFDAGVSVGADADWMRPSNTATADAGNTAFFLLDSLTPGADFSTGSGLTYSSAVPEPTSLVIIGFAALPLMQRRRRS